MSLHLRGAIDWVFPGWMLYVEYATQKITEAFQLALCLYTFGVVMYLELVSDRGGSLVAKHFTRDIGNALAVADKLKAAGLRPNVVKSGPNYVVYITTSDLLKLAEEDDAVRRAIALYLAEKAKNDTPRRRELAEKILKRIPFFPAPFCILKAGIAVNRLISNRNAELGLYVVPITTDMRN